MLSPVCMSVKWRHSNVAMSKAYIIGSLKNVNRDVLFSSCILIRPDKPLGKCCHRAALHRFGIVVLDLHLQVNTTSWSPMRSSRTMQNFSAKSAPRIRLQAFRAGRQNWQCKVRELNDVLPTERRLSYVTSDRARNGDSDCVTIA